MTAWHIRKDDKAASGNPSPKYDCLHYHVHATWSPAFAQVEILTGYLEKALRPACLGECSGYSRLARARRFSMAILPWATEFMTTSKVILRNLYRLFKSFRRDTRERMLSNGTWRPLVGVCSDSNSWYMFFFILCFSRESDYSMLCVSRILVLKLESE